MNAAQITASRAALTAAQRPGTHRNGYYERQCRSHQFHRHGPH
jgi:hypothetical protein